RRLPPSARSAILLAACVAGAILWRPWSGYRPYNAFLVGIALAALETAPLGRLRRPALLAPGLFAAGIAGLVLASMASRGETASLGWALGPMGAFAAGAVVGAPLLWQWSGRPAWRVLDNRVMRWAGSRSYSIYLVHVAILRKIGFHHRAGDHNAQLAELGAIGIPATLLASELLHRFVERPFLNRRAPSQSSPTQGVAGSVAGQPARMSTQARLPPDAGSSSEYSEK
ncbi:MAG: hypothetical protein QOG68_2202, partial [Solirubrobacteraceae bacterium]|nr:hypothetical protein [Solirubrobacteraceae bacterium]